MPKTPAERQRDYRDRQAEKLANAKLVDGLTERCGKMSLALLIIIEEVKDRTGPVAVRVRELAEEGLKA